MTIKVLVVDDSSFFRRRVSDILNKDAHIEVIGTASNGKEAVEQAKRLKPDAITMDYEMPLMDGISAVKNIVAWRKIPILMFSSMTYEGARITLDALDAGATDFLLKTFEDMNAGGSRTVQLLTEKIKGIAVNEPPPFKSPAPKVRHVDAATIKPKLVIIGTSTGGPVAIQNVIPKLSANFSVPIVIVQHMPASFTKPFAERLNEQCRVQVQEANDGEMMRAGGVYVAPGGMQLLFDKRQPGRIKIHPGDARLNYKPCVDVSFGSAAQCYRDRVLAVVLTGMGSDGLEGAKMLKRGGATLWAQDKASCVIWGMPAAVTNAQLVDEIVKLGELGERLSKVV